MSSTSNYKNNPSDDDQNLSSILRPTTNTVATDNVNDDENSIRNVNSLVNEDGQ